MGGGVNIVKLITIVLPRARGGRASFLSFLLSFSFMKQNEGSQ